MDVAFNRDVRLYDFPLKKTLLFIREARQLTYTVNKCYGNCDFINSDFSLMNLL